MDSERLPPAIVERPSVPSNMVTKTYAFVSLGCPKNTVDSERMLGQLSQAGYALTPDADGADVVVVNTCGFIEPARQESLGVIREMLGLKEKGRLGAVVVAGCLAQRKGDALLQEVPGVDHIVGVFGREEIVQVVDRSVQKRRQEEQRSLFRPAPVKAMEDTGRFRITPRHFAYLKISEGCDRLCTFCAIPSMRGKHLTKPIEEVVREAKELAADGVRELVLVAQDTTYYGLDLYGEVRLAALLRELVKVEGVEWIRLLYTYPIFFGDDLIRMIAENSGEGAKPRIVPYLDMPLQHIDDRLLKRMQRKVTRRETEELLAKLRAAIPGLALRTTFIAGFPGETEAEFESLVEFVQATRFDRLGVFPYSREPGTPADRLPDHLPEDVKAARVDRLMSLQQPIAFAAASAMIGEEIDVIVDAPDPEVPDHVTARGTADAPEIDCVVRLKGKGLRPGNLVRARVTGADGYDLMARALRVR
ncbi:MAG: 30S ribosomal protein S12 methylthiotransferase RimO [Gemmataceae bacterium]|nr:30S ribosomal protein S12 methylthiotransferase RimO [Gemmataceae bacterium]